MKKLETILIVGLTGGILVLGTLYFAISQKSTTEKKEITNVDNSENRSNYFERTNDAYPPLISDAAFIEGGYGWIVPKKGGKIYFRDSLGGWKEFQNSLISFNSQITFTDSKNGWLLDRYNGLLRTQDSGQTWHIIKANFRGEFHGGNSIFFLDSQNGWISDGDELWFTKNGGKNWEFIRLKNFDGTASMAFFKGNNGWLGSYQGNIYKYNGNNTISKIQSTKTDSTCDQISFADNKTGWLVCGGDIFKFNYPKNSWLKIGELPILSNQIYFIDDKIGWAVGSQPHEKTLGVALRTDDGGLTWSKAFVEKANDIGYLLFVNFDKSNPNFGWLVGSHRVYRTTDGGKNWEIDLDINSDN
jgi:photosystem II stability/assembly factor-like uncharacterized protein